jgi:uncharacterized protein (DUF1778 family)
MKQGTTRVPVTLSAEDRAEIAAAAKLEGITSLSTFLRFAALKLARAGK